MGGILRCRRTDLRPKVEATSSEAFCWVTRKTLRKPETLAVKLSKAVNKMQSLGKLSFNFVCR